jgi:hypothetical protein
VNDEPADIQSRVHLVQADMRSFELPEKNFSLATTPFRSFQHLLTVEDQLACLSRIQGHLAPAGIFILDVFHPWLEKLVSDRIGEVFKEEGEFTLVDGRRVRRLHRMVDRGLSAQVVEREIIYDVTHPDGRREKIIHPFHMRHLFRYEAEHLLVRSGFQIEAVYADYDRNPFGAKYPSELIVVARKAG